ncbi:MAG TPA: hypothetical protein PLK08_08580, partial [Phycisphaerae bacterium]|nr:hypothetical protein [Phycisphaerae bacterium]
ELITSRLGGYIKKCDIVSANISDGITTVAIRALVDRDTAGDDISAIQYAARTADNPRIAVVVAQITNDLFEDMVKNKTVERDTQVKINVERRRLEDAKAASLHELDEGGTRVSGNFGFWNRRPRPRNWTTWTAQERSAWITQTAENEYRNAVAEISNSESFRKQKSVWSKVTDSVQQDGMVQSVIEKYFVEQGLNLVSQSQIDIARQREMMLAGLSGNPDEMTAVRASLGADILITGTATASRVSEIKVGDAKLYRYNGEIVVRAYNVDNGRLLAVENFGQVVNSTLPTGGADDALRTVARTAAISLADSIANIWTRQWQSGRAITLSVSGMTFDDWQKFKAQVQNWPRVTQVRLRSIAAGRADIEITTELGGEYVASRIAGMKTPAIEVTGFEQNNIRGKIRR